MTAKVCAVQFDFAFQGLACIFAACVGLASVTFALGIIVTSLDTQEERYQPYRYASDKPLEVEATGPAQANAQAFEDRTPCKKPKGQGESDLCAQWRAANAAEDSALWTKWGVWVGVIGSSLLLWQIALTRQAVEDTGEATEAMRKANEIARDAQRPWLDAKIELHGIAKSERGYVLRIELLVENVGGTPANHLAYDFDGWFYEDLKDERPFSGETRSRVASQIALAVKRVVESGAKPEPDGLTVFPRSTALVHVETEIFAKERDGFAPLAWLVVGLRYFFAGGEGITVKVFNVRSFGLPNETGFDSVGEYGHTFTDTNAKIVVWESGGYAT